MVRKLPVDRHVVLEDDLVRSGLKVVVNLELLALLPNVGDDIIKTA